MYPLCNVHSVYGIQFLLNRMQVEIVTHCNLRTRDVTPVVLGYNDKARDGGPSYTKFWEDKNQSSALPELVSDLRYVVPLINAGDSKSTGVQNSCHFFHFFTPIKIKGGMSEMSERTEHVKSRTQPLLPGRRCGGCWEVQRLMVEKQQEAKHVTSRLSSGNYRNYYHTTLPVWDKDLGSVKFIDARSLVWGTTARVK